MTEGLLEISGRCEIWRTEDGKKEYRVEVREVDGRLLRRRLVGWGRTRRQGRKEPARKLESISWEFSMTSTQVERIHPAGGLSSVRGAVPG